MSDKIARTYRLSEETIEQIRECRKLYEDAGLRTSDAAIVETAIDFFASRVYQEVQELSVMKRLRGGDINAKD